MNSLESLQSIFNGVQSSDSKEFNIKLADALNLIPLDNSFLKILDILILSSKASLPPKILHFLKRIIEELNKNNRHITNAIFSYLTDKIYCKHTRIRRNSLRLVHLIVLIDSTFMTFDILQKITERLFDKEASVRKEALRIVLPFQNQFISESVTIQTTIKDIVRYDPSNEIRKIGFLSLEFSSSTLNCILERCIDSNMPIRRSFWTQYFPKIDLKKIDHSQRIYLMKKGINEREFDAKSIFIEKMREYGLADFIADFYCEDEEYEKYIQAYLAENDEIFELEQYTPSYLNFICCYYKIKEEKDGRDSLKLLDIEEFLKIFYFKCNEAKEKLIKNPENAKEEFAVLKYFLKILGFYDIFTDSSRKNILSIINTLILQPDFSMIVEDCIMLAVKICDKNINNFVGSLIKKTRGKIECFLICEYAMKHLPYGEMFDAILKEIVVLDIERSFNIFFWYLIKNYKENVEQQYLNFLPHKRVIDGCTDLIISNVMAVDKIETTIADQISKFNPNVVIPVCKLLSARKINNPNYIKCLLLIFYSTDLEYIQQYLSLFFFEFFKNDNLLLLDVFCDVLELITANHKVFVDQTIFWISNCITSNSQQILFYKICVFILNNYDNLTNKKSLLSTLFKLPISDKWEPLLTKKIIFLVGFLIKKRPREDMGLLMNKLIEIDDGAPLPPEDYELMKSIVEV